MEIDPVFPVCCKIDPTRIQKQKKIYANSMHIHGVTAIKFITRGQFSNGEEANKLFLHRILLFFVHLHCGIYRNVIKTNIIIKH